MIHNSLSIQVLLNTIVGGARLSSYFFAVNKNRKDISSITIDNNVLQHDKQQLLVAETLF